MVMMEKIVPPRNSGRNAKRVNGGIARAVLLLSIFAGMNKCSNSDHIM